MLPVPTVTDLALYSGRGSDSYGGFAPQALTQATLLFTVVTRLTELPSDPDKAQLAKYAILQMADRLYLEQPNVATLASPYQSETIGSYSYSKGSVVTKARDGGDTGLFWWDLAVDQLSAPETALIDGGSYDPRLLSLELNTAGGYTIVTPADRADNDSDAYSILG